MQEHGNGDFVDGSMNFAHALRRGPIRGTLVCNVTRPLVGQTGPWSRNPCLKAAVLLRVYNTLIAIDKQNETCSASTDN